MSDIADLRERVAENAVLHSPIVPASRPGGKLVGTCLAAAKASATDSCLPLAERTAGRRSGLPLLRLPMRWTAVIGAALLAACSTIPSYPPNLPALVEADTTLEVCPPIAGTFSDTGSATSVEGRELGSVSLTRLLHSGADAFGRPDVVVVKGPQDDLVEIDAFEEGRQVAAWRQPKVTKELYLAKGDRVVAETFLCQDGFVRLGRAYSVGGSGAPGLVVLGVKSEFLWLRKATDGSLIALHTNADYAVVDFVLPLGRGDKIWYRFPPAPPPLPRTPGDPPRGKGEN